MVPRPDTGRRKDQTRKAVDVSTHRRAWKQRAGVVVAAVLGALLTVPATPALAAKISTADNSVTIDAGQSSNVNVVVRPENGETSADIDITGLPDGVTCGGCGPINFEGSNPQPVKLTLSAAPSAPAANGTQARISVTGGDSRTLRVTVKPTAPPTQEQTQTVKSISGKVIIAANNEPVAGATVMIRDSKGQPFTTTSDNSGNFRFTGSTANPIAPGRIELGASKDGKQNTTAFNAAAGESVTGKRISLAIEVEVTPSATPSPTEEAEQTEEATEPATEEATPTGEEAAPAQQQAANQDSGGFSNWLLILLGGLFVAVGVGTIVLLYVRRRNEGDNADGDDEPTGPGGSGGAAAVPAARGAFRGADDQTRVVGGMGAGPAPTMVGGTSLSDAPTMLHRPVVDDVPPDPYGAPPGPAYGNPQGGYGYGNDAPGQGGYGGAPSSGAGYGGAPSSGAGYGGAPSSGGGYGGAPSSGGGYGGGAYADGGHGGQDYGAGAGGYPPVQGGGYGSDRYDEPTGRYTGDSTQYAPPADPYPTTTYQPDDVRGYEQPGQGQYGRGAESGNAYGSTGGYGGQQQGYDSGQQQGYDGYDQRGGYGGGDGYSQQGSYNQQGSYSQQGSYGQPQQGGYSQEQPPQQRSGAYDNPGYDQGGYHGDPTQAGRGRPDAPQDGGRRLDWLDD
ncbi:carboxypeptidase-like regulatory domain-containing protein [Micromonospora sp. NPDC006766]|uniref:carboxypeptidase-like regulatory domain-containing protein n=1 Tax=Micromonospora sp. NPDC006766 TaxID=3154778 RepID=UPI0033E66C4A